jgi:folate-dependent phosphoribosylglycinamide formyltransferase PurN
MLTTNSNKLHVTVQCRPWQPKVSLLAAQTVVSDKPGCGGWKFAQSKGIAVLQFPSKKHESGEHAVTIEALPATLRDLNIDFICLAGFLKVR